MMLNAPQGFQPWPPKGPFIDHVAQLFLREDPDGPTFGVRVDPVHCNGMGLAHGAFISTLADAWSSYVLAPRLSPEARFVTSSLTVDFLSSGRSGDWLQSEIDRIRIGRRMCLVTLAIVRDRVIVALARANFALMA